MHVHDAAVVEANELVLAAALYGTHSRPSKCAESTSRQTSLERGVQHIDTLDDRSIDRSTEETDGTFDLRKFRHESGEISGHRVDSNGSVW
jgi:hypothetical protein